MTHRRRGVALTLMETRRDMNAATLRPISGGRFVLGLGASTRPLVEGFRDIA